MSGPGAAFHLGQKQSILVTRKAGEATQAALIAALDQSPAAVLTLDFAGVEVIDYSFADAAVAKTISRLVAGELGPKYLVLANLAPEWAENIDVALKQRQLAALAVAPGAWQVLGAIKDYLLATLRFVMDRPAATARELGESADLTVNAANNRLAELFRLRLVQRSEVIPPGGGKQFNYQSLVPIRAKEEDGK